jgi:hypothetical protein
METILDLVFRSPGAIVFDVAWKSALVLAAAGCWRPSTPTGAGASSAARRQ